MSRTLLMLLVILVGIMSQAYYLFQQEPEVEINKPPSHHDEAGLHCHDTTA